MNRAILYSFAAALLVAVSAQAADTKTDLTRDLYIENSTADFTLAVTNVPADTKLVFSFSLAPPDAGTYTLVCFVDGKMWSQKPYALPGEFRFNAKGILPGMHRLTVQAIDQNGRLGAFSTELKIE